MAISVYIVEDDRNLRENIRRFINLSPGFECSGVFGSGEELLAAEPGVELKNFQQDGRIFEEDKLELGDPAVIDSEVPGIDLTKLTADQKEAYKKKLENQQCTCGCKLNLLKCRQVDRNCTISRKLAQDQLDAFLKPKSSGVTTQ